MNVSITDDKNRGADEWRRVDDSFVNVSITDDKTRGVDEWRRVQETLL